MRCRLMWLALAAWLVLIPLASPASAITEPDIKVIMAGQTLQFDVPPRVVDGRTLVPMRAIFEALGATVHWDDAARTVTAWRGPSVVRITMGSLLAEANGSQFDLDVPPRVVDGRALVPLRFIGTALGAVVHWEAAQQTVFLSPAGVVLPAPTPAPEAPPSPPAVDEPQREPPAVAEPLPDPPSAGEPGPEPKPPAPDPSPPAQPPPVDTEAAGRDPNALLAAWFAAGLSEDAAGLLLVYDPTAGTPPAPLGRAGFKLTRTEPTPYLLHLPGEAVRPETRQYVAWYTVTWSKEGQAPVRAFYREDLTLLLREGRWVIRSQRTPVVVEPYMVLYRFKGYHSWLRLLSERWVEPNALTLLADIYPNGEIIAVNGVPVGQTQWSERLAAGRRQVQTEAPLEGKVPSVWLNVKTASLRFFWVTPDQLLLGFVAGLGKDLQPVEIGGVAWSKLRGEAVFAQIAADPVALAVAKEADLILSGGAAEPPELASLRSKYGAALAEALRRNR